MFICHFCDNIYITIIGCLHKFHYKAAKLSMLLDFVNAKPVRSSILKNV